MRMKFIFVCFLILPFFLNGQEHTEMDNFIALEIIKADSLRRIHRDNVGAIDALKLIFGHSNFEESSIAAQSNIYHKIAVNFYGLGEYEKAIDNVSKAIVLRKQDDSLKKEEIAHSFFLRGLLFRILDKYESAVVDLKMAVNYIENYPSEFSESRYKRRVFDYYNETAIIYDYLKDIAQAEKYYDAALRNFDRDKSNVDLATFYTNYGTFSVSSGNKLKGFQMLTNAMDIYYSDGAERNIKLILDARSNIAIEYLRNGEYNEAIKSYEKILSEIETYKNRYSEKEFISRIGLAYRMLGLTENKAGHTTQAKKYYLLALDFAQKENSTNYSADISKAYEGLADVSLAEKKWDKALSNYQNSIKSLCYNFAPDDELTLPILEHSTILNKKSLKRVLSLKANALQAKYTATRDNEILLANYNTYQTLDTLITQIRQSYDSDLSRYDIIEGTIPIYEKAALAALQLYEKQQDKKYLQAAFDYSSKNKAIVLLEDQQDDEAKFAGIPKELLKEERALKKEFFSLEQEIFTLEAEPEKNKSILDSIKQVRFQSSRNYEKLIANFEENYPEYHQLKYADKQSLAIAQISAALPPQSAMVEYFIGLNNILTFCLTKDGLQYYSQPKPANFDELCQSYRQLSEGQGEPVSLGAFADQSHQLYELLLQKPMQALQKQSISRLFIIPDDYLHEISFDALLTKPLNEQQIAAGWGVDGLPILLRSHAISFVYSNRLLYDFSQLDQQPAVSKKLFAGFGLDYRDETYVDVADNTLIASRSWRDKIRPLPYAVEEIEKIGELLGGDTWINEKATKANFNLHAADYKIIHLAMHGLVEKEQPLNSALIFNEKADSLNYLLTAGDLYSSTLKAEMVVLSACDTGTGQLQKGEGAMTLARAFNYAGCPSLVASLWSAADEPTKELMIAFYKHLQDGHPKDVALQLAKLNHLDQGLSPSEAPPHFWSHLVIIGNTSPIDLPTSNFKFLLLALGAAFLLFAIWQFVKR